MMRSPALQPSVSLSTVLNPFQALLTFNSERYCLSLAKKMTCLLLLTCANGKVRKLEGIQESLQVTKTRKKLKWSIGKIAFYSFGTFQSHMSRQTISGFSNSYDPAQTAPSRLLRKSEFNTHTLICTVYVYVRQLYRVSQEERT